MGLKEIAEGATAFATVAVAAFAAVELNRQRIEAQVRARVAGAQLGLYSHRLRRQLRSLQERAPWYGKTDATMVGGMLTYAAWISAVASEVGRIESRLLPILQSVGNAPKRAADHARTAYLLVSRALDIVRDANLRDPGTGLYHQGDLIFRDLGGAIEHLSLAIDEDLLSLERKERQRLLARVSQDPNKRSLLRKDDQQRASLGLDPVRAKMGNPFE